MSQDARRDDPGALPPSAVAERFLEHRRVDATDETLRSYRTRLEQFVEWCDEQGIERIDELDGWLLDEYRTYRQPDVAVVTLKGHMVTVKQLVDYADRLGAVEANLGDRVPIPRVSRAEESSGIKLATDDATALLEHYRESRAEYGTPRHVVLELLWHVGCRRGALVALDLEDYHPEERYLEFRHRPEQGTPLKNKEESERPVAIPPAVVDAIDFYIDRERSEKRDEYGRRPLFAGRQGRVSTATVQAWTYLATQPCAAGPCPHDEDPRTCQYRERNHASKCPSSRSPHQVRTGSITWQLDQGLPIEVVAERVDARPETIRRFYDKASRLEKLEHRRREWTDGLDIGE